MSYSGESKIFDLANAAFSHGANTDSLRDETILHGSKNLYPNRGLIGCRGGTEKLYETAFTSAPEVVGIGSVTSYAGLVAVIVATGDGKIYKNATDTIKTGLSTNKATNMTVAKDDLFICNGTNTPEVYAYGDANTHTLANPSTDWTSGNTPKIFINHSLGASTRLVAAGVAAYPYTVYINKVGDLEEFRAASGGRTVPIWTKHPAGLTGGISFGNRCILFDRTNAYYLDDSNSDDTTWGYIVAQWSGGLAHERLVCKSPNDVYCMTEDGIIYSVQTAEQYGDYKRADISQEQYMHEWVKEYIDLDAISEFHCCYDPDIKAVRYFMRRKVTRVADQNDVCLLYYIYRPEGQRWFIEDNHTYASGYDATCSAIITDTSVGYIRCYTGDYSGFVWQLNAAGYNDDDNAYYKGIKLRYNHFGNPLGLKAFKSGHITGSSLGGVSVTVKTLIDGVRIEEETVALTGGSQFGSAVFGTAQFGAVRLIKQPYEIRNKGYYLQTEIYNNTVDEDFNLASLVVQFKHLQPRPGY